MIKITPEVEKALDEFDIQIEQAKSEYKELKDSFSSANRYEKRRISKKLVSTINNRFKLIRAQREYMLEFEKCGAEYNY